MAEIVDGDHERTAGCFRECRARIRGAKGCFRGHRARGVRFVRRRRELAISSLNMPATSSAIIIKKYDVAVGTHLGFWFSMTSRRCDS
jgi:hypothetical protein